MGIYSHRAGKTSGQMGCAQGETLARGVQGMQQQCKGARVKSAKATTRRRRVNKRAKQQQGGGGSISAQSNKNAKKMRGWARAQSNKLLRREIDIYIQPIKTDVGVLDHNLNIP